MPNKLPETRLFWDKIELTGKDRLQSLVHLYWSGDDEDGFIKSYEISTDNINWYNVLVTDSIFRFPLTNVADTADINFYVRSIDNQNGKDPTPATLRVPIKNTRPISVWDSTFTPFDSVLSVLTLKINANDVDGNETIEKVEIKANDGNWISLPAKTSVLNLSVDNPKTNGVSTASIYLSDENKPLPIKLDRVNIGGAKNVLYLRCTDLGGLVSDTDTSKAIYIYPQTSDIIIFDGWKSKPSGTELLQKEIKKGYGIASLDKISLLNPKLLSPLTATNFGLLFKNYKEIYWISESLDAQMDILETSESIIQNALNTGKKLFMCIPLEGSADSLSSLFRYSPMERLTNTKNGLLKNDGALIPTTQGANYSRLVNSSGALISGLNPFIPKPNAEVIYEAELVNGQGEEWVESRAIVARAKNPNGKTNFILTTAPLFLLNQNDNLKYFFENVKSEFNW